MNDLWIGRWLAKKHNDITVVTEDRQNSLIVFSHENIKTTVMVVDDEKVTLPKVLAWRASAPSAEMIFNSADKTAFYDGDALNHCEGDIGLGGIGDLMSVIRGNRSFIQKAIEFPLRGLRQHTKVTAVNRENNCTLNVERKNMKSVRVLAVSDYEVTADAVRTAVHRFGLPDVILKTNPSGTITAQAEQAASSMGVTIRSWGELLGDLNHKW